MLIKPSTSLRNEYNKISDLCKEKQVPVFLTKNGEGDLVVMDIQDYNELIAIPQILAGLAVAEENRKSGVKSYSIEETKKRISDIIKKVENENV